MSGQSDIEWTDATWNPVTGCSHVSEGCKNCYAETFAGRGMGPWKGRAFTDVRCHPERLDWPLRKRKPMRVFVNSMSDLFHDDVPDTFIESVFGVMATAGHHTFQVLTKRPERMAKWFAGRSHGLCVAEMCGKVELRSPGGRRDRFENMPPGWPWPLKNVWLGVSVENQRTADERIPLLLQTPAAVRFLSCEPLLGPVDLTDLPVPDKERDYRFNCLTDMDDEHVYNAHKKVDWVIVGGESGHRARPCDTQWILNLICQGKAAGIPMFIKQLGSQWARCYGFKRSEGGNTKGGDPLEWPTGLRVREFPENSGKEKSSTPPPSSVKA